MADFTSTRRGLLGAMALAPMVIAAPAMAQAPAYSDLIAQLDALDAATRALDANPLTTEAEWDEWEKLSLSLSNRIEALPATRENVPVKVRLIKSLYLDRTPFEHDAPASTSEKVAQQVVRALAA